MRRAFLRLAAAAAVDTGGAIYDPAEFVLLGEYVASGAYRGESFASYKQSRRIRQGT